MKTSKICDGPNSNFYNCWSENATYLNGSSAQNLFNLNQSFSFILADGTLVGVGDITNEANGSYSVIYIDINGFKKPNRFGRDIFRINCYYKPTEHGANRCPVAYADRTREEVLNPDNSYSCHKNNNGILCGGLIQHDGWQIKDDYPW